MQIKSLQQEGLDAQAYKHEFHVKGIYNKKYILWICIVHAVCSLK